MAAFSGPKLPKKTYLTNYFDVNSIQSLDLRMKRNHMLSKWYAHFDISDVRYAIIGSNSYLFRENSSGNVEMLFGPLNDEVNEDFIDVDGGYLYFSNNPIVFYRQGINGVISPLTMAGNYFWYHVTRNSPEDFYLYSPYFLANVNVYVGGNGIDDTPSESFSMGKRESGVIYTANTNSEFFFESDVPIIMTKYGSGDRTILHPMLRNERIYIRSTEYYSTNIHTNPGIVETNFVKDTNRPAMVQEVADAAGGESSVGLGYSYLSNTYILPEDLASYYIVAPNENTVYVEYWDGSDWALQNTHSLSGTLDLPATAQDGTQSGVDVPFQGASNKTWRFRGDDVFYVVTNDNSADEECLLGYMRNEKKLNLLARKNKIGDIIEDVIKSEKISFTDNNILKINEDSFSYIEFERNDKIELNSIDVSGNWAISCWVYLISDSSNTHILTSKNSQDDFACKISTTRKPFFYTSGAQTDSNGNNLELNTWYNLIYTYDGSELRIYVNGELNDSKNLILSLGTYDMIINGGNDEYNDFRINNFAIYNESLNQDDAMRIYTSFRRKYK